MRGRTKKAGRSCVEPSASSPSSFSSASRSSRHCASGETPSKHYSTVPVKRNELDSIRRLLDELDVTDALITIDAIGCQHDVAEQVLEAGGDYVLQVKGNQPTLLQELEDSFPNISKGYTVNKEEGLENGRIEHRQMKNIVLSPEMLDDSYAFKD